MKAYLTALGVGVLVGVIYAVLKVRSPAPPVIALVGLMGMLLGEQVVPLALRLAAREPLTLSWMRSNVIEHIFGELPKSQGQQTAQTRASSSQGARP